VDVRHFMFPYGMVKDPDGSWTLINRRYKPLGVISRNWVDWDDPRHKFKLAGLKTATLAKLDYRGEGLADEIYFYDDGCIPTTTAKNMESYLAKLKILMGLKIHRDTCRTITRNF
jgi:hypothetical protein